MYPLLLYVLKSPFLFSISIQMFHLRTTLETIIKCVLNLCWPVYKRHFPCVFKNLPNLFKKANCLEAFMQISATWSSRFNINSMFIPNKVAFSSHVIWAAIWQNQQSECAPSEDSDQPGHPPSLIRVFAVRMKKAWVLSYPMSAQRRLWSDWTDAQADLSLRWAHTHFVGFVMSRLISLFPIRKDLMWSWVFFPTHIAWNFSVLAFMKLSSNQEMRLKLSFLKQTLLIKWD